MNKKEIEGMKKHKERRSEKKFWDWIDWNAKRLGLNIKYVRLK